MSKQVADVVFHAADTPDHLEDENLDISVDYIDDGLYLGNLACARDYKTLKQLEISHILTVDLVPLPRTILDRNDFVFKFIKLADVPKEDLITHLPETNEFIKEAINSDGTVLVHCYFGVSRSAAVVIAYIMEKYGLCFDDAFSLVKAKRRFIGPNIGFIAQLKLFGHMGYKINKEDPRFKQFRLKMAGQKLKQVKILPRSFADVVKADPGVAVERPQPSVYRCRRCRRVLAQRDNLIPHLPRDLRIDRAKKGMRPPPSAPAERSCESGAVLMERLQALAHDIQRACTSTEQHTDGQDTHDTQEQLLDGYTEQNLVDSDVCGVGAEYCRAMWFVEPLRWMEGVSQHPAGKLHCPKCHNKVGSYNWIMGCKCPCGQKVAPAFYLVPSKVEWANIVQNVQVTV